MTIYRHFENESTKVSSFLTFFDIYIAIGEHSTIEYYNSLRFRLKKTIQCIERVFKVWPPHQVLTTIVNEDKKKILEASIQLDAFVLNCHAIFDNIAHIWNEFKPGTKYKGLNIGIMPTNNHKNFIKELPDGLQALLKKNGMKETMKFMKDVRDSLAHRIPLQISETDTYCIANEHIGSSEKILKTILKYGRIEYYSKLAEGIPPDELLEKYRKFFKIRPIFNLTKNISKKPHIVSRYKSCFGHEYIHCFMLEMQQLVTLILLEFLTSFMKHLNIQEDQIIHLNNLRKKINNFLVFSNQDAP